MCLGPHVEDDFCEHDLYDRTTKLEALVEEKSCVYEIWLCHRLDISISLSEFAANLQAFENEVINSLWIGTNQLLEDYSV